MKPRTALLALIMLLSLFLGYQQLTRPRPGMLSDQRVLSHTDTASWLTIHIDQPATNQRLSYTRESTGWLVTDGHRSTWVPTADMQHLMTSLLQLRTEDVRKEAPDSREQVGVTILQLGQAQPEQFLVLLTRSDSLFVQFPGLPEAYAVGRAEHNPFFRTMSYFQPPTLFSWEAPDSLLLRYPQTAIRLEQDTLQWTTESVVTDTVRWHNWLSQLPELTLPTQRRAVDQLPDDSLALYQMTIWDGGEMQRILAYSESTERNEAVLIWSSYHAPYLFRVPDSTWLHRLFPPDLFSTEEQSSIPPR